MNEDMTRSVDNALAILRGEVPFHTFVCSTEDSAVAAMQKCWREMGELGETAKLGLYRFCWLYFHDGPMSIPERIIEIRSWINNTSCKWTWRQQ